MAVIIVKDKLKKSQVDEARKEHKNYIKITADILQNIIAIGGQYHADAEKMLLENCGSKQKHIWGGGYSIDLDEFETIAIINIRQPGNCSMDILDAKVRKAFLDLVKLRLSDIKSLL